MAEPHVSHRFFFGGGVKKKKEKKRNLLPSVNSHFLSFGSLYIFFFHLKKKMVARGNGRRFAPKKKIESFAIFIQLKKKEMISFFFDRILVALGSIFVLIGKKNFGNEKKIW